jgi:hypothetical protein
MSEAWKWVPFLCMILSCSPHRPKPEPTPAVTPTPSPEATPRVCSFPYDAQPLDGEAVNPAIKALVRDGQKALGDMEGRPCEESLSALAGWINATPTAPWACAERVDDAVMVLRPDSKWEEHHACYYGNGRWTTNEAKGVWGQR